jgi:pectate lyase
LIPSNLEIKGLCNFADSLLDVTCGSSDGTVSMCRILKARQGCALWRQKLPCRGLVHPGDHQCFSHGTRQRQPHVRFSMVHLYKNDTMNWGIYTLDLAAII